MKRFFTSVPAILGLACVLALLGQTALAGQDGLEVGRSGTGLVVTFTNPKDGAAGARSSYATDAAGCGKQTHPCYIFTAINGTAPLPATSQACEVEDVASVPTVYCAAAGVTSVTIIATRGGTIGYDASGSSEMGKNCMPASVTYKAGGGVFSILAHDGCPETVVCVGTAFGTVDVDANDIVEGKCKFVQRH